MWVGVMAGRRGGDDLDDLSATFALDDALDDDNDDADADAADADAADADADASEPAPAQQKKAGRKRKAQEAGDDDLVSWLGRNGGTIGELTQLEELCGGLHQACPLLEALPSRSALRSIKATGSILVLCSSAARCLELVRAVKAKLRCPVAKLFAKHMKLVDQLEELRRDKPVRRIRTSLRATPRRHHRMGSRRQVVCVGTPHRVAELLRSAQGLRASAVRLILVDGTPDRKMFTMLTQREASQGLKDVMQAHFLSSSSAATRPGAELTMRLVNYAPPVYSAP